MTTGGVFTLVVNDGKSDRMIHASKLLYQRIQDIMYMRTKQGRDDITPTLIDLERTHIIYVNAHFKPHAAIGFEYNKVKPQSGSTTLGGSVTFSIPQFGDFFYDMVARCRIGQVYANSQNTPLQSGASGAEVIFPLNTGAAGAGTNYNLVDVYGNQLVAGIATGGTPAAYATYRNNVRYCEFPGNRLFTRVKFDVNGNPLDEYDQYVPVMLDKFTVLPHKREGHDRLVGQQTPRVGVSGVKPCPVMDLDGANSRATAWNQYSVTFKGSATASSLLPTTAFNTPSGINVSGSTQSNATVGLFLPASGNLLYQYDDGLNTVNATTSTPYSLNAGSNNATAVTLATPAVSNLNTFGSAAVTTAGVTNAANSQVDLSQVSVTYFNGPQTPKPIQPPLEIWNKLKFWFNDDVGLSIPSVSIPYGQRFITIDINTAANLVYEVPTVFLQTIQYNNTVGTAVIPGNSDTVANTVSTVRRIITYTPLFQRAGLAAEPTFTTELYVNNIFVNPEIHDIFIRRIGFALIRVYRQQRATVSSSGNFEVLLSNLKWPVEYMFVGVQPLFNQKEATTSGHLVTGGNINVWRDWHRMTRQLVANADKPMVSTTCVTGSSIGQVDVDKYYIPVSTVDSISLVSHGIKVYDGFSDTFFNQYQPFHYGCEKIVTPNDSGAFFINLCLFPRTYQPSGHLNISRARETYLNFTSSYFGSATNCLIIIVAVCINFILISDGSAVLRYST